MSHQISSTALDYLLIEMIPTLRESSAFAQRRLEETEKEMREAGLVPTSAMPQAGKREKEVKERDAARDSVTSLSSTKTKHKDQDDEEEGPLLRRLETMGAQIGSSLADHLALASAPPRAPFTDTLDIIKFICKDLWVGFFSKQIDNLRTNHRGVYVLQDNAFRPITRLSSFQGRAEAVRRARVYASLPAGLIKGVLSRLGFAGTVSVTPEITSMPQCTFQIKLPKGS